jgi:hypothetical protein
MCFKLPKCERIGRICATEIRKKMRSLTKMLSILGLMEVREFFRQEFKADSSGSFMVY